MERYDTLVLTPDQEDSEDTPFHYYDSHLTEEDLMGESLAQSQLIAYLLQVLQWLYHNERWFIVSNLNIYRQRGRYAYPWAPDVAVFKGIVIPPTGSRKFKSWRTYEPNRPPPHVVLEISSDSTWENDVQQKPVEYGVLGVREYFAYDPNAPPYWTHDGIPLRGWRYVNGQSQELVADPRGRLWSEELESWLVPDDAFLRMYDRQGRRRLTEGEAERAAREIERQAKEAAWQAREAERAACETERQAKEAERAAKEAAWAKLRELGIDPESL
jgi:Uma2 family endonuclease